MKRKSLFILLLITFFSCEKSPEQKANTIIKEWMSENMPNATYTPSNYLATVFYTKEEQRTIDSLYSVLEDAKTYTTVQYKLKDGVKGKPGGKLESVVNSINESLDRFPAMEAQKRVEDLEISIRGLQRRAESTVRGEKGYKVDIKYKDGVKFGRITFFVDPEITTITEVEKEEKDK